MTDNKFQNKYRIQSARAAWHRYDGGVYFVTICTKNRKHYFGEIVVCRDAARHVSTNDAARHVSTQMRLSEIGRIATENIQNVTLHYPYAEIPLFVVMPNHIHAIVVIDGNKTPYNRGSVKTPRATDSVPVETWRAASLQTERRAASQQTERCAASTQMTDIANMQGWLSVVIGGLKSAITRCAHENHIEFAWQTRFHDRIVHNQDELNRIAEYIENNVAQWHYDDLNNKCIK